MLTGNEVATVNEGSSECVVGEAESGGEGAEFGVSLSLSQE